MKLRYLATVVVLALTTVAAHAQKQSQDQSQSQGSFGLYFNPLVTRVSNSVVDTGSFAFLGQNSTSQIFWGYDLGGYYDFVHSGKINAGLDVRFSDQHINNAMLKNFLVGVRVSASPFGRPFKPYLEAAVGEGHTKAPAATVQVGKPDYAIFGGVDYSFARHVDFRVIEIGYGSLTTVSSGTVGAGGNVAIPSAKLLNFSSGLVFRF